VRASGLFAVLSHPGVVGGFAIIGDFAGRPSARPSVRDSAHCYFLQGAVSVGESVSPFS
jgi:hypothetical protein